MKHFNEYIIVRKNHLLHTSAVSFYMGYQFVHKNMIIYMLEYFLGMTVLHLILPSVPHIISTTL